jgi:hypothetical protein
VYNDITHGVLIGLGYSKVTVDPLVHVTITVKKWEPHYNEYNSEKEKVVTVDNSLKQFDTDKREIEMEE